MKCHQKELSLGELMDLGAKDSIGCLQFLGKNSPPISHQECSILKDNLKEGKGVSSIGKYSACLERKFPSLRYETLSDPFTESFQDLKLPSPTFGKKKVEFVELDLNSERKYYNINVSRNSKETMSPTGSWFGTLPSPEQWKKSLQTFEYVIIGMKNLIVGPFFRLLRTIKLSQALLANALFSGVQLAPVNPYVLGQKQVWKLIVKVFIFLYRSEI